MMEFYCKDKLVSEEEWSSVIDKLQSSVSGKLAQKEAVKVLKKEIIAAVKRRIPSSKFGVFFSGGVDSSLITLICKQLKADFTCYSVGFKTEGMDLAPDLEYARRVADHLGVDLKLKVYDMQQAENIIKDVVAMLPKPATVDADFVVKVGVGCVVVAAHKLAKEKLFFSGLGSEELFAGYDRHSKVDDVNAECWRGLKLMWARDLIRDCSIASSLGIKIATPFLDEKMIVSAMKVPGELKLKDEKKKIIIRQVAEELGLDKEFAWRKKMGAQYGSRFDRAIAKLAKKKGFKTKGEYLQSLLD